MPLRIAHLLLVGLYALLPAVTLAVAIRRTARTGRARHVAAFTGVCVTGTIAGIATYLGNAKLLEGTIRLGEMFLLVYLVIAVFCALWWLDRILLTLALAGLRVKLDPAGRPMRGSRWRALIGLVIERLIVLAIAVPYLITMLAVYRPKVITPISPDIVPSSMTHVDFQAGDGVNLAGWWIAAPAASQGAEKTWGKQTILLCHGYASGKEAILGWAKGFVEGGFNVMVFDFRGSGESDGHITSFGCLEQRDVLAAVRWVKANHAGESEKLFGVGINTGAVALLAAAADPEDGQRIDAISLYEPYADFSEELSFVANGSFPRPVAWLLRSVGVHLASAHSGADLGEFSPRDLIAKVWPRPVLIVHGRGRTFVDVGQEMQLYRHARLPCEQYRPADDYQYQTARMRRETQQSIMLMLLRDRVGVEDNMARDPGSLVHTIRFFRRAKAERVL